MDTSGDEVESPAEGELETGLEKKKRAERRPSARLPLPTDRIALPKQWDIARAYGQLGETGRPVTNAEVGAVVGLNSSTTSLANSFLSAIGLLQKSGDGYVASAALVEYARAYRWDVARAPQKLAQAFASSWFGTELLPKIRFRPHSVSEAITILADTSAAHPDQRSQLEGLISFLDTVGLVRRDGEMLFSTDFLVEWEPETKSDVKTAAVGAPSGASLSVASPEGTKVVHVPSDFVVYRCKIGPGKVIEIPLPPSFTKREMARLTAFLETQVDDEPEAQP